MSHAARHNARADGSGIAAAEAPETSRGADSRRRSARFQVALGDKPGEEPAAVSLVVRGKETFIGTLRKAKCDQFSVRARAAAPAAAAVAAQLSRALLTASRAAQLDLALGESFSVKHTGKSAVFVTGWRQMLTSASDEDEESDEEGEEEEEEESPRAAHPPPKKAVAGGNKPLASSARPEKPGLMPAPPAAAKKAPAFADSDSDDSSDSGSDDDAPPPPVSLGKRPADRQLMSPAPKKTPTAMPPSAGKTPGALKTPLGGKTPATPAAEPGLSTPGSVAEFEAQVVSFLKTHGRTGMSALGGKVKKPGNVPKLNAFIKERPHLFKLIGDQVELVKKVK